MKTTRIAKHIYACVFFLCIASMSYSQEIQKADNRALSFSFSQRNIYDFVQKRLNAHHYFIEKQYFQTGAYAQYSRYFKEKEYLSEELGFGATTNIFILPFKGTLQTKFRVFIPYRLGFSIWSIRTTPRILDYQFEYSYGLGAQIQVFKHIAMFCKMTNDAITKWHPNYTAGLTFQWNK